MKYFFLILFALSALVCQAAIYQQDDKQGNITYSDHPLNPNAKIVELIAPVQSQNPQSTSSTPPAQPTAAPAEEAPHVYSAFSISSPKNEETFQNQRDIPIEININPQLKEGDQIQLFLDGKPSGTPAASTHLMLADVARGMHVVAAVLIDKNQVVLKQSQNVTIYVHLASAILKPS